MNLFFKKTTLFIAFLPLVCFANKLYSQSEPILILEHESNEICSICFSPKGDKILTGGDIAIVWDSKTGEKELIFEEHIQFGGVIASLNFSPDGKKVITGGYSYMAFLWDINTGEVLNEFRVFAESHPTPVVAADFSPDGKKILLVAPRSKGAIIYDAITGNKDIVLDSYPSRIGYAKYLNPDEILIREYESTKIFSVVTGSVLEEYDDGISYVINNGENVLHFKNYRSNNHFYYFYELYDTNKKEIIETSKVYSYEFGKKALSPNGHFLFIAKSSRDEYSKQNRIINTFTGTVTRTFDRDGYKDIEPCNVAFSPDGTKLGITYMDKAFIYDISDLMNSIQNPVKY